MTLVLDYSFARPDPSNIRSAGYSDVMRYLSPDSSKNLSGAERDALWAAGLGIGLVWESTATRAAQGLNAGKADAVSAAAQAKVLGFPVNLPIFFAVDFDAQVSQVVSYFTGVKSVLQNPVGVYGSAKVVDGVIGLGLAKFGWQTMAWSGSTVSPNATLYQRIRATVSNPVAGSDENLLINDMPFWVKNSPLPAPAPAPVPNIPHPAPKIAPGPHLAFPLPGGYFFGPSTGGTFSVSGKYHRLFDGHFDYWWLQQFATQLQRRGWNIGAYLKSGNDGVYGPEFESLIKAFQKDRNLTQDGEVGPATWRAAFESPVS